MDDIEIYPYRRTRPPEPTAGMKRRWHLPNIINRKAEVSKWSDIRKVFARQYVILALVGFLLGRAVFLGELNPFIGPLVGVMSYYQPQALFVLWLAALGGIFQAYQGVAMWSTVAMVTLIALISRKVYVQEHNHRWVLPGLIFAVTMITKSTIVAWLGPSYYNFIVVLVESILNAGMTIVLFRGVPAFNKLLLHYRLSVEEIFCLAVMAGGVLTGLNHLEIGDISLQGFVGRWMILLAAYLLGLGGGAAVGTLVGIVPSLATLTPPLMAGIYAFGGLLAGTGRNFGRLGTVLGFTLGNIILSVYLLTPQSWAGFFGESLLAIAAFLLVPAKWLLPIDRQKVTSTNEEPGADLYEKNTKARLAKFAGVFEQLAQTFEELAVEKQLEENKNWQSVLRDVGQKACGDCSKYRTCWEKDFYHTYKHVLDFMSWVELNGNISSNQLSDDFKKRCHRPREIAVAINCLFEAKRAHRRWQRQMLESREILSGQLKGLSSVMDNLAEAMLVDKWSPKLQRWPHTIEVGATKAGKAGNDISGDSFNTMWLPDGKAAIILSDGMGTGSDAAKESSATVDLLGNLLVSGMEKGLAVRTVNSLLVMGARDETFATVDLVVFDLCTAVAEFIKIGAAASFIKRGAKVGMIKSNSWPIGILHTVEFEVVSQQLHPGDLLIMVTDGVVEGRRNPEKEEWILDFLQSIEEQRPQKLAEALIQESQFIEPEAQHDDMTVLVIAVKEGMETKN